MINTITPSQIQRILDYTFGQNTATYKEHYLFTKSFHNLYFIKYWDVKQGDLKNVVLKINSQRNRSHKNDNFDQEPNFLLSVTSTEVGLPRVLSHDTSKSIILQEYFVMTYIGGQDLAEKLSGARDEKEKTVLINKTADIISKIHGIEFSSDQAQPITRTAEDCIDELGGLIQIICADGSKTDLLEWFSIFLDYLITNIPEIEDYVISNGDLVPEHILFFSEEGKPFVLDWDFVSFRDRSWDILWLCKSCFGDDIFGVHESLNFLVEAYVSLTGHKLVNRKFYELVTMGWAYAIGLNLIMNYPKHDYFYRINSSLPILEEKIKKISIFGK